MGIRPNSIIPKKLGERGQSTAEFVAVLPILLIVFFLIVEFGWLLKNYLVVTNAAREVARCAAVNDCRVDGTLVTARVLADSRIRDGGAIYGDDDFAFDIRYVDQNSNGQINKGDSLIVCIDSPSRAVTPLTIFAGWTGVLPNPFHLKARTEMRVEVPYAALVGQPPGGSTCSPT